MGIKQIRTKGTKKELRFDRKNVFRMRSKRRQNGPGDGMRKIGEDGIRDTLLDALLKTPKTGRWRCDVL